MQGTNERGAARSSSNSAKPPKVSSRRRFMQEFYVTATRKLGLPPLAAKAVIKTFDIFEIVHVTPLLIDRAIDAAIQNKLGFWDALVVASASASECRVVYSEDLNHGQTVLGVQIQNPFKR